jgi:hypothetical protein
MIKKSTKPHKTASKRTQKRYLAETAAATLVCA